MRNRPGIADFPQSNYRTHKTVIFLILTFYYTDKRLYCPGITHFADSFRGSPDDKVIFIINGLFKYVDKRQSCFRILCFAEGFRCRYINIFIL